MCWQRDEERENFEVEKKTEANGYVWFNRR